MLSGYASWSVVYGEQPSATKWGILGTNDGIFDSALGTGWNPFAPTLTFVTATTVTVAGDYTGVFQKGMPVRLKQGGGFKYYYVAADPTYSAPDTTITLNAGSTYTVANAAITDVSYSTGGTPFGFTGKFSYVPVWTAAGVAPAIGNGSLTGQFSLSHGLVTMFMKLVAGSTTTFGTGDWSFTMPLPESGDAAGSANVVNSAVANYSAVTYPVSSTTFKLHGATNEADNYGSADPFTWGDGDYFWCTMTYLIG